MKSNSNKFGTYTSTSNNYNSMIDEYRRNKILYSSKKFNLDPNELFKILKIVIHKTFKIKRDLEKGLKFNFKNNDLTLHYEIEELNEELKEISITWKMGNDQYWLKYNVKKCGKKSKIKYKQIIFRDKTFFGLQDAVGIYLYRINFRRNIKIFNKAIAYVKNNPDEND